MLENGGEHFVFVHRSQLGAWCWLRTMDMLEKAVYKATAVDLANAVISRVNAIMFIPATITTNLLGHTRMSALHPLSEAFPKHYSLSSIFVGQREQGEATRQQAFSRVYMKPGKELCKCKLRYHYACNNLLG